jgi:hypothetical protein
MNRLKDYVRFIHGFQVYRPSHVDSVPILLSFLSLMPSYTLQRILTVLCLLSSPLTMMNFFNSLRSSWFTHPVVIKTPVLLAWLMAVVPRVFPSHLEQTLLSLRTLMLALNVTTLARFLRSREDRSITNGWSIILHILSGSTGAISMWSLLPLSRQLSTSTSMCIRAMIIPQWSLADVVMR